MTDFGRRRGEMLKSVYDTDDNGVVDEAESTAAHAADHQRGGDDEISVAALSGELADDQPPKAHALGGAAHVADTLAHLNTKVSDATLDDSSDSRTPLAHKASHGVNGTDPIDCTGLVGRINLIDRGDPAAPDWTEISLTKDGAWHDLDLSPIVPAGAIAVQLRCHLIDDVAGSLIIFRKNGNTNLYNCQSMSIQVANIPRDRCMTVFCDTNRVIEYFASGVVWTSIQLVVCGWWI